MEPKTKLGSTFPHKHYITLHNPGYSVLTMNVEVERFKKSKILWGKVRISLLLNLSTSTFMVNT